MNLQEPLWLDIEATQIHLGHMVILGLPSRGNLTPIFIVTALVLIPTQKEYGFHFPTSPWALVATVTLMTAILTGMR